MKNTRKIAAFVASVLAVACMAAPMTSFTASALDEGGTGTVATASTTANQVTITLPASDTATHTFNAYQIFSGTVNETTGALENIQWGSAFPNNSMLVNTKPDEFIALLQADQTIGSDFTNVTTAAAVAKVISGYSNDSDKIKAFAAVVADKMTLNSTATSSNNTISLDSDGYYLITDSITVQGHGAVSTYILSAYDASEGAVITAKSALPEVIKKIKENDKTVTATGQTFAGTEDYNVGKYYNDVADYCTGDDVPFKLYGTLPKNIAAYKSYKYIFHDTLGTEFKRNNDSIVVKIGDSVVDSSCYKVSGEGTTLDISFDNLLAATSENTPITIDADSIVTVEYTARLTAAAVIGQPGQTNEVYLEYSNNPNAGGEGATGTTPKDKVIAFTYELDLTKIDGVSKEALAGAEFIVQRTSDSKYAQLLYNDESGYYTVTAWADDKDDATTLAGKGEASNEFKIAGLDDGKYNIYETKTPAGYTAPSDPFVFELIATTANDQVQDADGTEFTALALTNGSSTTLYPTAGESTTNGIAKASIENKSGSSLPSTGGIGTTIFVVGGGAMVAVAGVLLVSKKRMSK